MNKNILLEKIEARRDDEFRAFLNKRHHADVCENRHELEIGYYAGYDAMAYKLAKVLRDAIEHKDRISRHCSSCDHIIRLIEHALGIVLIIDDEEASKAVDQSGACNPLKREVAVLGVDKKQENLLRAQHN